MRFSVLAVELSSNETGISRELLHDIAAFAARENASCILLSSPKTTDDDTPSGTWTSQAQARNIQDELSQIGLRYEIVVSKSPNSGPVSECAILTQLSLLASIVPPDTDDRSLSATAAARLAVAPHSVIDTYSVAFGRSDPDVREIRNVVSLVESTEEILERRGAEKPRRRGPIRRGPKVTNAPVRTRFVCIAGPAALVSQTALTVFHDVKLTPVTDQTNDAPAILVRPAIKPVASTSVTLTIGHRETRHGAFVAFDL